MVWLMLYPPHTPEKISADFNIRCPGFLASGTEKRVFGLIPYLMFGPGIVVRSRIAVLRRSG